MAPVAPPLVLATEVGDAGGIAASAAAVATVAATEGDGDRPAPVAVAELGADARRGPTMLASSAARELERRLSSSGHRAAARGTLCWLTLGGGADGLAELGRSLEYLAAARLVIAVVPGEMWHRALGAPPVLLRGGLVRCELPAARSLAALTVMELRERGMLARVDRHGCGPIAARRAIAGLDPGGAAARRARRAARAFLAPPRSTRATPS